MSGATSWQMPSFDDLLPNAGGVAAPVLVPGIVTPGNVDLATRPTVPMPDGSIATVRSMSFNDGEGREVLIPTISDDGRLLSDDEAIALYRQSGRHLGIFATPDDATAYAKQLSQQQGRDYGANTGGWQMPSFDDLVPKQSLPAALGNTAMSNLIGSVGQNIAGPARMHQTAEKGWADTMLHAVGMLAFDEGAAYRALTPVQRGILTAYRHATPERQAEMQAEWQSALAAGTPSLVEAGTAISDYGRENYPVDPAQQGVLTNAVGMAASLPAALVAGGVGALAAGPAGGIAGMTAAMFGQAYEATYQGAVAKGATPEQASEAATKNAAVQSVVNVVPLTRVLNNIPAPLRDKFVQTIAKIGQSGLEFAGANALGRFAENFVMRETVDPATDLAEGVWDDAKAGALLGTLIPGVAVAGRQVGRTARNQLGPAASPEFRADLARTEALAAEAQPTIAPEVVPMEDVIPPAPDAEMSTPAQGTIPLQFDPNIPTMRITPEPEAVEPPRPPGTTRMYHGGQPYDGEGGRWLSPSRQYAEGYADQTPGAVVHYIDIPNDSPLLIPSFDATGTDTIAPPVHFEATPEMAAQMRQLSSPEALPEGPAQDVLPTEMGRPAEDVAPAPDAVFPEPIEPGAMPPPMADLPRPAKPPSLFDFLISKGGVRPDGDLMALGLETVHHQRAGRLLNKKGAKADMAREAAVEAGYLPPDATLTDFYDALAEEHAGRPVYPPEYASEATEWARGRAADRERIRGEELAVEARAAAEEAGIRLTPDEEMHAARLLVEGARPEEAVYEAVRASDVERTQAYNEARGMLSAREKGQADQRAQGAPSPEAGRARQELAVVMQRLMRQSGLPSSVGLKVVDRLVDAEGNAADASYTRSLVTYALDTPAPEAPTKLFHEVTHALMDPSLGVLTAAQRNALLRAADRWLAQGENRQGLADLRYTPEQMREEAVARVAEEVLTRARQEPPITTRAVEAMTRAVEAIGAGLRGQGFWSADGVFRAVMQGRVKGDGKGRGNGENLSRRPPKPPPSGPDLFGGERREPEQRAAVPTYRTDPRQEAMPGMEPSAVQAQASRDQTGRGGLEPRVPQARPDEGLFAPKAPKEGSLFSRRAPETEAFKRWFGDSAVVDKSGAPKVVYHGTNKTQDGGAFTLFDTYASRYGLMGMGAYFTESPTVASSYTQKGKGDAPTVYPAYLSIKRPLDMDAPADVAGWVNHFPDADEFHEGNNTNESWFRAAEESVRDSGAYAADGAEIMQDGMRAMGYDGITHMGGGRIDPNSERHRVWIAFDPEQVKSATGNQGTFDPGHPDIRLSRRATRQNNLGLTRPAWEVDDPSVLDSAIRLFQDNKVDLKRVQQRITDLYGPIAEGRDAYGKEERYHGKVASRVRRLHEQRIKPILQQIAKNREGVTVDDVDRYLLARHAPERNAAMQAINPNMANNDALSGMSDADAAATMAAFGREGKTRRLEAIARNVDRLTADTRRVMRAEGLESAETIRNWEDAYQFYAPLQRDVEGQGSPTGSGFNVRGPESKRAMGSTLEVKNILANIVAAAETTAIRAEKNKVTTALADLAKRYPADGFWKVDEVPTTRQINKSTGLVETIPDPLYQLAENVLMYKEGGKHHFIEFNEKNKRAMEVARAMKNLGVEGTGEITRIAAIPARFMASLLTRWNPEFWVTNFIRDASGAQYNWFGTGLRTGRRDVIANIPKAMRGLRDLYRGNGTSQWAQYAREMDAAGGTTGHMDMYDTSDKRMDNLKSEVAKMQQGTADPRRMARATLEMIDDYNSIVENSVRLAAFQAARKQGLSAQRAASIAKNITVNFNRKGNLSPAINAWFMFFNAAVQGSATLVNAAIKSPKARAVLGGMALTGFLLDTVNREVMGEEYDMIPDFEKSHNAIFSTGDGSYVKVPYPLGLNAIFNIGRLTSEGISGTSHKKPIEYGLSMAASVLDSFNPMGSVGGVGELFSPSVARPVVQLADNRSFTGAPVYKSGDRGPRGDAPEPAHRRHFQNTPELWVAASRGMNALTGGDYVEKGAVDVSPDALRHVFTSMTGGIGRAADRTLDYFTSDEPSASRMPFVGRVAGKVDDRMRERAYMGEAKRINTAINEVDFLLKSGRPDAADDIIKKLGKGDLDEGFRILGAYRGAKKELDTLRRREAPTRMQEPDDETTEIGRIMRDMRRQTMERAFREGRP